MNQSRKQFWTGRRLALAAFAFAAVAVSASSCTSKDTANLSAANRAAQANAASKPKVSVTAQQGAQPKQTTGAMQVLPPEVLNAEIRAVDGGTFRIADFKDKVVVLNLWATWCGPCRQEIPHLVELNKEYKGKGVELIGLTTENPETDSEKVHDFAEEFQINYKLGWADGNMARALMQGDYRIPQSLVIAPGGRIQTKFRGFSRNLPSMIRTAIDQATEQAKK